MSTAEGSRVGRTSSRGSEEDRRWMDRALALARRGWGRVFPNPMVGAVVVNDGRVVGEGYHGEFGGPHAEVRALQDAGEDASGSTLYVNLEPCRHRGKTPPCTRAVLRSGVRRVVVGCRDPDAEAGGGAEELAEEGVEVQMGVRASEARRLNVRFLWNVTGDRPYVQLKYGLSLDGYLGRRGERTRVTGEESWVYAHRLRAGFRAILVGRRTVEVDDPRLTARGEVTPRVAAIRTVLDPALRTPLESRLVATADRSPVCLVAAPDAPADRREALENRGVRVLTAELEEAHRLRPASVLAALEQAGARTILVEGGGRVGASFLREDLVDRLVLIRAPVLFGEGGVPAFPGEMPSGADRWEASECRELGRDLLWVLDRARTLDRIRRRS